MKIFGYSFLISTALAFNVWAFGELSFDKELSIDVDRAKDIFIDVGSGNLNVTSGDVDEVVVKAKIYSSNYRSIDNLTEALDNKMDFSINRKGSSIVLKATNKNSWFGFKDAEIDIDLDIIIPRKMDVEIDDGSGDMWITNIGGSLEIDDGSGSTKIDNVSGKVVIDDGSGNLIINNIGSHVTIDDGSGKILLNHINGNVFVDDGSGELTMIDIIGDVKVDDGSGSINVTELVGEFTLIDGGSGSVHINGKKWAID